MSDMGLIEALGRVMGETLPAPVAASRPRAIPRPARLERPDRMRDPAARWPPPAPPIPSVCTWPADWFCRSDPMDAARCLVLWQAVLLECLAAALVTRQWS